MLTRFSAAALDGLQQIARGQAWQAVEASLRTELAAAEAVLRESTDQWALARAQGRVGAIRDLLDLAAKQRG